MNTSSELYEYYKNCLNQAIHKYREQSDEDEKDKWLKFSHRASCLTDIWLRISKEYARRKYGS